jgi:hypothetical protein
MRYDKNFDFFIAHFDWYNIVEGVGYVPTKKAPPEAVKAMETYNAYTFGTQKQQNNLPRYE